MARSIHRDQIRTKMRAFIDDGFGTPAPDRLSTIEIGSNEEYDRVHLPGAIHLSSSDPIESLLKQIQIRIGNLATEIILYQNRDQDPLIVKNLARALDRAGYGDVFIYPDGKEDWLENGLWVDHAWQVQVAKNN